MSEIAADVMDAIQGDPSDIMMRLLSGGNNPLSRLVGNKPVGIDFEEHHLIPQQFKEGLQGIFGESFDIHKFTVNLEKRFHQRIVHGNKDRSYFGGVWNRAWGQFLGWDGRQITRRRSANEVGEFMQGLLGVLTGL